MSDIAKDQHRLTSHFIQVTDKGKSTQNAFLATIQPCSPIKVFSLIQTNGNDN